MFAKYKKASLINDPDTLDQLNHMEKAIDKAVGYYQ